MEHMRYDEIMEMICDSCDSSLYYGHRNSCDSIINATTQIYITQMEIEAKTENQN